MPLQSTPAQDQIQQAILDNLQQQYGFVLIEGDPGSGKTFIKNLTLECLSTPNADAKTANSNPLIVELNYCRYSFDEIIMAIATSLEVRYQEGEAQSCLKALTAFCQHKMNTRTPVTVVIDDAQYLPIETLEALKEVIFNVEDPNDQLPINGILFSDRSLKPLFELSFLTESLVHTIINIPRPSEAEMRLVLQHIMSAEHSSLSISDDAEMELLMQSAGNFRKAKQLLDNSASLCQQEGKKCIDESMIVNAMADDSSAPEHTTMTVATSGEIPESLQGILSSSLLDTPEKPVLKKKRTGNDIPLFVNDLSIDTVNPLQPQSSTSTTDNELPITNLSSALGTSATNTESGDATEVKGEVEREAKLETEPESTLPTPAVENNDQQTTEEPLPSTARLPESHQPDTGTTNGKATVTEDHTEVLTAEQTPKDTEAENASELKSTQPSAESLTLEPLGSANDADPHTAGISSSTAGLSRSTSADNPQPKRRRVLPLVAAVLLTTFVGILGWLTTQPGFAPEQKIQQLKTKMADILDSFAPELASQLFDSNASSTESTETNAPVSEQSAATSSLPKTIQPKTTQPIIEPKPFATSTTPNNSKGDQLVVKPEFEEVEALVKEVEARLEQEKSDASELTQIAINDLAKTDLAAVKAAEKSNNRDDITPTSMSQGEESAEMLGEESPLPTPDPDIATSVEENSIDYGEETPAADIKEIEELLNIEATLAQITMLKKKAQIHIDNYRYTIPENDNAVLTLRRIQELDNGNRWAQDQLDLIREQYFRRAELAAGEGNRIVATQNYGRLLWINPNDPEAKAAINKLPN